MSTARTIMTVLCLIAAFAAILSLVPFESWPVELAASFRLQIAIVALLLAIPGFLTRARVPATIAGGAAIVCAMTILPLAIRSAPDAATVAGAVPDRGPSGDSRTPDARNPAVYRILTINLEWTNRRSGEVLAAIRDAAPDILVLQEVDYWWREQFDALVDMLPDQRFDPLSRRPGVAILLGAGIEVEREEWLPLHGRPYADFVIADRRGARGDRPAAVFRLTALHALPPRSALLFRARTRQLDDIRTHLSKRDGIEPRIVVGDFNTTPWSPSHRRFTRELNLVMARRGFGLVPTWPTWNSLLRVPIDHILLSPGFAATDTRSVVIPGSDHHGLLSELRLTQPPDTMTAHSQPPERRDGPISDSDS